MSKRVKVVIATVLLASIAGGAAYALWPEEPEEPEVEEIFDRDTGMSRQQVEEMMRTIGYVQ